MPGINQIWCCMTVNSVLRRWRREDQNFNSTLRDLVSSKPAWATRDPISGGKSQTRQINNDIVNAGPRPRVAEDT